MTTRDPVPLQTFFCCSQKGPRFSGNPSRLPRPFFWEHQTRPRKPRGNSQTFQTFLGIPRLFSGSLEIPSIFSGSHTQTPQTIPIRSGGIGPENPKFSRGSGVSGVIPPDFYTSFSDFQKGREIKSAISVLLGET